MLLLTGFFWEHLGTRRAELVLCRSSVGHQRNAEDSLLRRRQHPAPALHLLLQKEDGVTQERRRGRALLGTKEKLAAPFIVQKAPSFNRSEAKVSKTQQCDGDRMFSLPGPNLILKRSATVV